MLDHVLNLGNQLSADLVKSDNFPKFNYDRILVVGMDAYEQKLFWR